MKQQEGQVSVMPSRMPPARPLGAVLQEQGKMSPEDVQRVLMLARDRGLKFGEAARSLGMVCASDVEQAVALQYDYKYLQPGEGDYAPELSIAYEPFGEEAENLRQLRNLLMECWFERGNKALAIAALSDDQPCSMLAANLAVAFAQLGLRTLLVDANLRRPRQEEIFRCSPGKGLTDFLAGRAEAEALFPLPHFPSLHVLTAGTLPPNSHELLGRPACRDFFEHMKERFDVVLVDTPAFTAASEAFIVGARTGAVLLVCERDRTRMRDLHTVSARLANTGSRVVGSIYCE